MASMGYLLDPLTEPGIDRLLAPICMSLDLVDPPTTIEIYFDPDVLDLVKFGRTFSEGRLEW